MKLHDERSGKQKLNLRNWAAGMGLGWNQNKLEEDGPRTMDLMRLQILLGLEQLLGHPPATRRKSEHTAGAAGWVGVAGPPPG